MNADKGSDGHMVATAQGEKELRALKRVENAARRLVRYPNDVAPRRSLSNALRLLDQVRKES